MVLLIDYHPKRKQRDKDEQLNYSILIETRSEILVGTEQRTQKIEKEKKNYEPE